MDLQVENHILSFRQIPGLAEKSEKTVLLLRHSMRESLNHGTDPVLTRKEPLLPVNADGCSPDCPRQDSALPHGNAPFSQPRL